VQRLRREVATWRELAPAVGALCAPELRDRHWARAQELLGGGLAKGGEGVTLEALVEMQVGGWGLGSCTAAAGDRQVPQCPGLPLALAEPATC
jgi:hypothetical protein